MDCIQERLAQKFLKKTRKTSVYELLPQDKSITNKHCSQSDCMVLLDEIAQFYLSMKLIIIVLYSITTMSNLTYLGQPDKRYCSLIGMSFFIHLIKFPLTQNSAEFSQLKKIFLDDFKYGEMLSNKVKYI